MRYCTLMILLLMLPHVSWAQSAHGIFMVVKGDIQVTRSKDKTSAKVKVGDKVFPGDTISSGTDSRAKVVMTDKNILNVSPSSKLLVEKYEFKPEVDKKSVVLNVLYGKVRSTVNQKYDGEKNTFHVKTPTAVAGVRGTDFLTQHNSKTNESRVVTFEGRVDVGSGLSANGQISNPVSVSPGQFTVASVNTPPAPPAPVPVSEMASLSRETQIDTPAPPRPQERAPSEVGPEPKPGPNAEPKGESEMMKGPDVGAAPPGETGNGMAGPGNPGNGPDPMAPPGGGMGLSSADLNATAPVVGGVDMAQPLPFLPVDTGCTTCEILKNRPPAIPDDTLRNVTGNTKLNIQINKGP